MRLRTALVLATMLVAAPALATGIGDAFRDDEAADLATTSAIAALGPVLLVDHGSDARASIAGVRFTFFSSLPVQLDATFGEENYRAFGLRLFPVGWRKGEGFGWGGFLGHSLGAVFGAAGRAESTNFGGLAYLWQFRRGYAVHVEYAWHELETILGLRPSAESWAPLRSLSVGFTLMPLTLCGEGW